MELRHLRYFVTIAEEMNFGRAAKRLHISQPPLSQQIQDLEREIGVQLFDRSRRRIELTAGGEVFLAEAYRILAQVEQAVYLAQKAKSGQSGTLSIAFTGAAISGILPEILQVYQERFPEVELKLQEMALSEQSEALYTGQIEVSFALSPEAVVDENIVHEKLAECKMVVVLPEKHPLAQAEKVSLAQLAGEKWLWFPRRLNPTYHDRNLRMCEQAGFTPNIVQETTQPHLTFSLVAAGIGVALTSAWTQNLERHGVVYKPLLEESWPVELHILWHKGAEDNPRKPTLKQFLAVVRELTREAGQK
jgi:DNA-binding transcriptional LysR family regulator